MHPRLAPDAAAHISIEWSNTDLILRARVCSHYHILWDDFQTMFYFEVPRQKCLGAESGQFWLSIFKCNFNFKSLTDCATVLFNKPTPPQLFCNSWNKPSMLLSVVAYSENTTRVVQWWRCQWVFATQENGKKTAASGSGNSILRLFVEKQMSEIY